MKLKEKKNVYVQPDCQVIQVKVESIIATSNTVGTESLQEEDYAW